MQGSKQNLELEVQLRWSLLWDGPMKPFGIIFELDWITPAFTYLIRYSTQESRPKILAL